MRLRSAAAGETEPPEAADVSSSTASATQPAAVTAAGTRGDAPHDIKIMSSSSYTLASLTSVVTSSDRPTSQTLRLRDRVVWLTARTTVSIPLCSRFASAVSFRIPTSQYRETLCGTEVRSPLNTASFRSIHK
uniref:Uncharacterized protein n=1 Tax=Hyaloperonospora arabidopsidis (strain Emoy2) TaxID=559515 RepID=M4BV62_HYAAE